MRRGVRRGGVEVWLQLCGGSSGRVGGTGAVHLASLWRRSDWLAVAPTAVIGGQVGGRTRGGRRGRGRGKGRGRRLGFVVVVVPMLVLLLLLLLLVVAVSVLL